MVQGCSSFVIKIKNAIKKNYLYKRTLNNNTTIPSLNPFLIKTILLQLSILLVLIAAFTIYSYLGWQKSNDLEANRIKQAINIVFEQYTELAKNIEQKLNKGADYKEALDTKKYNKLFSLQKGYINIKDIHIVNIDKKNTNIYNKFGKESFAILPSQDFFSLLETSGNDHPSFYIENNTLFVGERIKANAYLLLKVDIESFVKGISSGLNLLGSFSIISAQMNTSKTLEHNYIAPLDYSNIILSYTPQSFLEAIHSKIDLILVVFSLFIVCSVLWIAKTSLFFKELASNFCFEQAKTNQDNITLKHELSKLADYKTDIESSLIRNKEFYYNLLYLYNPAVLEYFNLPSNKKEDFVNISKIITDCKSILFSEIHKNQIECKVEVSTEKEIEYDKSINLYVIFLNLLFKSIYKTPKKGEISISLTEKKNQTLIRIEDNAFDLKINNNSLDQTYSMLLLSDVTLKELAEECNIKIVKNPGDQANIIDIILSNKVRKKPVTTVKHGNVIHFPITI